MNNNTTKFYACNKAVTILSDKTWWSGYKILWGHRNIGDCEGLLIPQADYNNFLTFAARNAVNVFDKTYQMDITRIKSCFGDYWTLSNFAAYEGRYCPPN